MILAVSVTYSRCGMPDSCVWPLCQQPQETTFESADGAFPLCTLHALDVHASVKAYISEKADKRVRSPRGHKIKPMSEVGWIYYLRVGERIKIGHSIRLSQRLRNYPPDSTLLAVQPGSRADEQELHNRLATYCVRGREWYHPYPALLDHIATVVTTHGDPKPHIPTRRRPRLPVTKARA